MAVTESVVALFPEAQQAKLALSNLKKKGFEREKLCFALTNTSGESATTMKELEEFGVYTRRAAGGAGKSASATKGSLWGALIGAAIIVPVWVVLGMIPETRIYVDSGLTSMLFAVVGFSGMGLLFGALAGSEEGDFVEFLKRFGIPPKQARRFYQEVQKGQVLVLAYDDNDNSDRIDEALTVMQRCGAKTL